VPSFLTRKVTCLARLFLRVRPKGTSSKFLTRLSEGCSGIFWRGGRFALGFLASLFEVSSWAFAHLGASTMVETG